MLDNCCKENLAIASLSSSCSTNQQKIDDSYLQPQNNNGVFYMLKKACNFTTKNVKSIAKKHLTTAKKLKNHCKAQYNRHQYQQKICKCYYSSVTYHCKKIKIHFKNFCIPLQKIKNRCNAHSETH